MVSPLAAGCSRRCNSDGSRTMGWSILSKSKPIMMASTLWLAVPRHPRQQEHNIGDRREPKQECV